MAVFDLQAIMITEGFGDAELLSKSSFHSCDKRSVFSQLQKEVPHVNILMSTCPKILDAILCSIHVNFDPSVFLIVNFIWIHVLDSQPKDRTL